MLLGFPLLTAAAGLGKELTGTEAVAEVHLQVLRRVFFQVEAVGEEEFRLYHLHAEMSRVRAKREASSAWHPERGPRRSTAWELVSAGTQAARDPIHYPNLSRLLAAYLALVQGHEQNLPNAEGRLIDQLYRLSSSLCPDGCLACLHQPSSLMPDSHAALAVSRDLLRRYREMVLQPLTLEVSQTAPDEKAVQTIITEQGLCRLRIDPTCYDALRSELTHRGFEEGVFDPVSRKVVCIRQ